MKLSKLSKLAVMASATLFASGSVQAANSFLSGNHLILFFQKTGDTDTVYVSLGSAPTLYRGTASGPTADRQALNITDINTTLTSAFGASWASDTDIYAGVVAAASSSTADTVAVGDQFRTLYVSQARTSVGTVGLANSALWDLTTAATITSGAGDIVALNANFENNLTTQQGILSTSISSIDNMNPFVVAGIQDTAFSAFAGGIQQRGSATAFGDFGAAGQVEFALDLNRIVPDGTVSAGEVPGTNQIGTYEGTIVIGTNGQVSFITVPEPSSVTLTGLAGLALAFRRRRNA